MIDDRRSIVTILDGVLYPIKLAVVPRASLGRPRYIRNSDSAHQPLRPNRDLNPTMHISSFVQA